MYSTDNSTIGEVRIVQENRAKEIIDIADRLVAKSGNIANHIASDQNIYIVPMNFTQQKGAYCYIEKTHFVFIKADLNDQMREFVLLHEIGHAMLHCEKSSCFSDDSMLKLANMLEDEANLFAAHIMIPDEEIMEYAMDGYTTFQIATAMNLHINIVTLKIKDMIRRGYPLNRIDHSTLYLPAI